MPTEQEWNQMRGEKQINIQTLACLHDAVALVIAEGVSKGKTEISSAERIEFWLTSLYEIAESKKAQLTEVKPLNIEKAVKQGYKWLADKETEEMNKDIQETVEEGRQIEHENKLNYQP